MKGHIRQRGAGSFEIKLDIGRDAARGQRRIGISHRSRQPSAARSTTRRAHHHYWQGGSRAVGADRRPACHRAHRQVATARRHPPEQEERYCELPPIRSCRTLARSNCSSSRPPTSSAGTPTLKTSGRKDGAGGFRAHDPACASVASEGAQRKRRGTIWSFATLPATEPPPRVEREEIIILTADQVRKVVGSLAASRSIRGVIVACSPACAAGKFWPCAGRIDWRGK